jgi:LysM repeat protein
MKLPPLFTRKKLRAATARRALGPEMDYEEMSEPNMKLSRALLIVLVLHVVAVAGIVAFNTIKTRQGPRPPVLSTSVNAKTAPIPSVKSDGPTVVTSTVASTRSDESKVAKAPPKPVLKEERKSDPPKPAETNSIKPDSAKTYIVAKGDNPVSIAKKLKISYDDLMAVNHIDDPHKLKIGQKLIIPTKSTKPKKGE